MNQPDPQVTIGQPQIDSGEDNTVSTDTRAPVQKTVSIDTQAAPTNPTPQMASSRAFKAYYGLGNVLGMDYNSIYNSIQNGGEANIRQTAASTLDSQTQTAKMGQIQKEAADDPDISPDRVNEILGDQKPTDPDSVIEQGYAHQYVSSLGDADKALGGTTFGEAQQENPNTTLDTMRLGQEFVAKTQMAQKWLQDAEQASSSRSVMGTIGDYAKGLIPGYTDLKLRGNVPGIGELSGGLGLGTNLENQTRDLLMSPFNEFKERGKEIMDRLTKDNPQLAIQFAQAMVGQSYSQKFANNVFTAIDVASVPGLGSLGKMAARKIGLFNAGRSAVADMVTGQASTEATKVAAPLAAGNVEEAAVQKASIRAAQDMKGQDTYLQRAIDTLTSNWRLDKTQIEAAKGDTSRETLNRIYDQYDPQAFISMVQNTARIESSPIAKATQDEIAKLQQEAVGMYPQYRGSILDVSGPHDAPLGIGKEFRMYLGNANGKLYSSEETARVGATAKGIVEPVIEPQGAGFRIVKPIPIRQTSESVRDLYLSVPDAITPNSWLKATLGWIQTPAETSSVDERINRVVATYAPNKFLAFARQQVTSIKDLSGFRNRQRFQDFERFVESGQQEIDPVTKKLGRFYNSPQDVKDWYLRNLHRAPDDAEVEAYFGFKRVVEMDRMMREIAVQRNMHRVGSEMHSLYAFDKDGKKVSSPYFGGVLKNEFPGGDDGMLVMRPQQGNHLITKSNAIDGTLRTRLKDRWEKGIGKVIEVYDPEARPLEDFVKSDSKIRYIYTEGLETKPLSFDQIPRRGGGHFQREYDHYVVQANMRHDDETGYDHYEGDNKIAAVEIRGMGDKFSKILNDVRDLLNAGKPQEARALGLKTIPQEWFDKFLKNYGKKNGINPNEPFRTVPHNRLTVDMDNSVRDRYPNSFRDGTRHGSLARTSPVEFTKERDAYDVLSLKDEGTKDNPMFALQSAKLIDALPMMNRGLARIIQSNYMDQIKFSAIEAWAKRNRNYLKADPSRVAFSPYRYYMEAAANSFKKGTDAKIISQAMSDKAKIDMFIGMPSKLDTFLHSVSQSLADSIYEKAGPRAVSIAPTWMIPKLRDPSRFIRSVVYNEKVGLFSIPQFLVHATTYSTVLGVAGPRRAIPGTYAAMLHGWATLNPAMLDTLDRYASKLNMFGSKFRPGEFKESVALADSTGFLHSEHENAYLDSVFRNQLIKSKGQQFLDAGAVFFRSGLQSVRAAAWHTAYREFRDQFPDKLITNVERNSILDRADLLAHNMTRASSSLLNTGFTSLPFQFYTYQLRLAEIMMGKRITNVERARLLATNAILFGMPVAASVTGIPMVNSIRQYANEHGYIVGDKFFSSMAMEGGLSEMGKWITGHNYDIGSRYGTKGFEPIEELRGDKTIWQILGGAAGQTLSNGAQAMDGFWRAMLSSYKTVAGIPQEDGENFPMTTEDVIEGLTLGQAREVSSINAATRFKQAVNTGHWLSKNGTYLSDASGWDAFFMSMTGLVHQETADIFPKIQTITEETADQKTTFKKFNSQMEYAFQAQLDDDPEQASVYFKRAQAILIQDGYPVEKLHEAYSQASRANMSLVNRINWDYYMKNLPTFRKQVGEQTFQELQQMEDEK